MVYSKRSVRAAVLLVTITAAACSATPTPSPSVAGPTGSATASGSVTPLASPATKATPPPTAPAATTQPGVAEPIAGRWASAGELLGAGEWLETHRTNAVPFGSSKILVLGADNICTPGGAWRTSALAQIGTATGGWTSGPSLPRPRDYFVAAPLPGGSVIVAGGTAGYFDSPGYQSFISTERLSPGSGAWTRAADLTQARSMPTGAVLQDGRVLLAAGYFTNQPAELELRMLDSAELYDPTANTWTPTGSLEEARYGAGAVTLADGRVLVVGGWGDVSGNNAGPLYGSHGALASSEVFDPGSESWTSVGSVPVEVTQPNLVALPDGGALIVADGRPFRFDPRSGAWSGTGAMVTRAVDRTLVPLIDGRVLAAGGAVGDGEEVHYIAKAEIYDPATDRWAATARMPTPRSGGTGLLTGNGSVVIVGGSEIEPDRGVPSCPIAATGAVRFQLGG